MRRISIAILLTIVCASTAEAASRECRGIARHIASGSVALTDEPVMLVPARGGRCSIILSGWAIQADPEAIFGSGGVNIGDRNVAFSGTGGFVPPTPDPVELATEDEVWAVMRPGHPNGVISWIELYD